MVGDLVMLKTQLLGNSKGSIGVCYEDYELSDHSGSSFIFVNGSYDGFSEEEQKDFLCPLGSFNLSYDFKNVMILESDFRKGVFDESFKKAKELKNVS